MYWTSSSGRIELKITKKQAAQCTHPSDCEHDVKELKRKAAIYRQMDKIAPELLAAELSEYGAWDNEELKDHEQNKVRLLWLACGDITEGNN